MLRSFLFSNSVKPIRHPVTQVYSVFYNKAKYSDTITAYLLIAEAMRRNIAVLRNLNQANGGIFLTRRPQDRIES